MINRSRAFSLIELLLALATTLALSAMMFHLFQHNERVVRDRTLVMDMQQTARVVASQIADEIRMAGQGVPVHSSKFDTAMVESMAVVLPASTNSRIDFRAGLSDAESAVTGVPPLDVTLNLQSTVSVNDGSAFSAALGTTLPSGKFIYLWGAASNSTWTWVRAELNAVTSASLTITPRQTSNTNNTIRFIRLPTVTLEEAVSIYLSGNSVRRATATDMSNPASPQWSAANEIGKNFTALNFTYFDSSGNVVDPTSLANRISIARVDVQLTVQTADRLSTGRQPTHSLKLRTIPRNLQLRSAN